MNRVIGLTALAVSMLFSTGAIAATVTPDEFLGSANLTNSGDQAQLDALADAIDGVGGIEGTDLQVLTKWESTLPIQQDDNGVWFVDVSPDEPGWFILKFGVGNTGHPNTYFFTNLLGQTAMDTGFTILAWTDVNINNLLDNCATDGSDEVGGNCRLSHITTVVPLPAAGLLLLSGIGGLALFRRRKLV